METSETKCITKPTEEQVVSTEAEDDSPVDTDVVVEDKESSSDVEEEIHSEEEKIHSEEEKSDNDNNIITRENLKRASEELAIEDAMPINRHSNNFYSGVQFGAICVICAYIGFITGIYVAHN
jgi:hypothetical protein